MVSFHLQILVANLKRMIKTCIIALFLISVLNITIPVSAHTESDPYVAWLKAGQYMTMGNVHVWNDGSNLHVEYHLHPGWQMTETHLYVGTSPPDKGSPGKFNYGTEYVSPVTDDEYLIPLSWSVGETIYIAAHAVVERPCYIYETAWAWGPCHSYEIPGRGWGWYFYYIVQMPIT